MGEGRYKMFYGAGSYWISPPVSSDEQYIMPVMINETGAVIWKYLQESRSEEQTAKMLADCYGITVKDASEDVLEFTDSLKKHGIKYI